MHNDTESIKKNIKYNIQLLIKDNKLEKAMELIGEYINLSRDDVEAYSIKAVLLIMLGLMEKAEITLKDGLKIDKDNFDLLFNLGYVYENTNKCIEAIRVYKMAKENCDNSNCIQQINDAILRITQNNEVVENITSIHQYKIVIYTNDLNDKNIEKTGEIFNIAGFINNKSIENEKVVKIDKKDIKLLNLDYIIIFEENREKAKGIQRELSQYIFTEKIYDYYGNDYPLCVEGFEYNLMKY